MQRLVRGLLIAGLLFAGGAFAGKRPQDFQEPQRMTDEEIAAAKANRKFNINSFGESLEEKPKPFPWMAVTLAGLVFLVATPFAVRAYRNTAKELVHNTRR